jgi:hypothetical protein
VAGSRYFDNHISGKERSRAGEAGPAMRENRQVFPHNLSVPFHREDADEKARENRLRAQR